MRVNCETNKLVSLLPFLCRGVHSRPTLVAGHTTGTPELVLSFVDLEALSHITLAGDLCRNVCGDISQHF
jgi:hypothetical protein